MEYFTKDSDGNYTAVTDKLHTQADMDSVIEKRLERERGKYADYDALKDKAGKVDTIAKEFEGKLKDKDTEIGNLSGKIKSAELQTEKVKITHEFKLSDDLAEFVTGETADEMRERAEKLAKGIQPSKINIDKDGKPDKDGNKSDARKVASDLFGRTNTD